jgi:hypothetical protein
MTTITSVAPNRNNFPPTDPGHSSSGRMTALALAADGVRLYAGNFAGVWRSDDGGRNWSQLTWPQPGTAISVDIPGALFAPHVFDIAASPTDVDTVLVSAVDGQFVNNRDGIYRSTDGGRNWVLVLPTTDPSNPATVAFAPDDAQLAYVALGGGVAISKTAGATWTVVPTPTAALHIAVGPLERGGVRRVYVVGDSGISYSSDGGNSWTADNGVTAINAARGAIATLQMSCHVQNPVGGFAGAVAYNNGAGAQVLAVEPGNPAKVYLATDGAANGPTFFSSAVPDGTPCNTMCLRTAGEASIWYGDFSNFASTTAAQWVQLPGPATYVGVTTPSGNCFVATKHVSEGFLLFFSDCSSVFVSEGTPAAASSWHRLDGVDASAARQAGSTGDRLLLHVDPHAIAFTRDFEITLRPATGVDSPYDNNSVLFQYIGGTIWMANDGGVNFSEDGGQNAKQPDGLWPAGIGLETIDPVNIAGLFGLNNAPALYFGCGDNQDFFSRDGGATWGNPGSGCGDCDCWFSDIAHSDRVLQFVPLKKTNGVNGYVAIIKSGDSSQYPDASDAGSKLYVPSTQCLSVTGPLALIPYASSGFALLGFRPIILTLPTEAPLDDGDYVFIDQAIDGSGVLRRTTAISTISQSSDWQDPAKAPVIGPSLPSLHPMVPRATANIVQVTGGHFTPVYFVGDVAGNIWRLDESITQWTQIVPNNSVGFSVGSALSWFVDPYISGVIYVLDSSGVKISTDGGATWAVDFWFTHMITAGGNLNISASLLKNMLFTRGSGSERCAFGTAGVFFSNTFGVEWITLLNSFAFPGRPECGFFDPTSVPGDPAVYVEMEGRSVVRLGDLPPLPPFQPPPIFDLMEFAAIFAD